MVERGRAGIPEEPSCAMCGVALNEPFGWCSNCSLTYCDDCGREHLCLPSCRGAGCLPGFCVRVVTDGRLGAWRSQPG